MRIAFNPSTVAALTTPPNNKDITFDLKGRNIFARGVKFYGTDTNTWRPVVDNLTSNSTTSSLSANQGRVLKALIDGKSDSGHNHDGRYVRYYAVTTLDCNNLAAGLTAARVSATNAAHTNSSVYLYISDIGTPFQIQIPDSNVPYIYKRYYSSGKWSGWFKLNAGYADSAGSVAWANITGKPSSYTPSAHTHAWNSLTHSSTTENQAILTNGKANGWKLYTLNISGWNNAANNAHSHSNKTVLDGITSALVSNWNTAYNFVDKITKADTDKVINKWDEIVNFLAGIDSNNKLNTLLNSKLSVYELADKTNVGTIKNNGIYYSTTDASSGTLTNSPFNTGFALINMTSYDGGDDLRRSRLAFNAFGEIKVSDDRGQSNTAETWYNVLTSKNSGISGSTIKLNGTSITVYSSGTADNRYVKKSGDTMTGALNFANGTWNLVGDDSYMGDCNINGHFGIKAANTTYPGIAFFNNASAFLGNLTAYSGNIKYGAYSLQFLDNGNTSVGASTWTNPFSAYDKNAVKDGQAICVWGQSSHLSNLATDSGDMSLWLKRVNANAATLNMVLDGEYYANGNQRLAHISEIPSSLKNPHALTISLNGTSQGPYDGSAAKSINITPGSIGAATSGHNHDGRYVYNYGGTKMDGSSRNKNALGMSTTSGISKDWWHILQAAWNDEYRWNSQIAFPTQNRNGMYYRSGLDDNTKWGAWVKLLDTGNSSISGNTITINGSSLTVSKSDHNHDYLVVNEADEKSFNSAYHNFQVLYASGGNGITGRPDNVGAFGLIRLRAAWGWSGQMLLANGGSLYIRSSADAQMTNTLAWRTILDSSNYSSILDSRYYTESEIDTKLAKKLDRVKLTTGSWNPRSYNLAADYHYNGGDLSISETGGQIHVSVDGKFWQNEGQYRVLDTSDITGIREGLTLYQYLSSTDNNWFPLVWGGSDHKNTNNSTGSLYKSHDKLSWQTSSQTLYATNIRTENIKNLSIGGGIYWNPYVESATDGSDAASITLVKSGVAGGTTLVLSQMNDTNDTIQFKTNTAARLYHNSYPILTTQNTYVSNNKGYINGTEITQVNNADKVDNRHAISTIPNTGIIYKAAIYTSSSLTSYWVRLANIPSINQNNEFVATIHVQSGHSNPGRSAILLVYLRGNASSLSKSFKICCNSNYDPNRFRLYYKDSDKTSEIWYQTTGQWDGIITTVISQSSEGSLYERLTLYSGSITAVQTPSMSTYLSAQVSTITDNISGNASTATKLATPRKIWGQSFDGTADVNGTIYINNGNSENGAIILNNNVNTHARISAIGGQVIFNTGAAIRFGETTWDWNKWAGLKYDSSTKTIYLGIADDSVFNANSAQRGGTINLKAGIDYLEAPRIKGYCKPASWLEGMAEERAGIIFQDEDSNSAYYPWIRQKLKDRYYSIGLQSTQICLVGSITSRTDNGYDASWRFDISNGWAYGNFQNADTVDGKHASDFASAGHTHDGRYLKLSGGTLTGGIEIQGTISGSNYASSEGFYTNEHNSLILRGDATYGKSGILFTSSKGTNSINQTQDKGFIQFQSYGGTNTTGEENKLVIGVGNDSTDMVYIQTPSVTGLKHVVGTNPYTIWDSGNLTKLSQLTNDKGFVTGSVNGKTITINGTSTTWSNTWRPLGTGSGDAAAGNHTHKVKINGSEKTIAATGVTDLGTYLTSQSLRGYVHAYNNTGTGNAVTSISIEGGTITANKGTTFLTSHQSLANYYTKGQVDAKLGKYLPLAGGTMDAGAQIQRTAKGGMWYQGRSIALLRETSANGYHALWSLKTTDGSWDFGEYNSSGWNNIPVLSYVLDSNFDKSSNATTYQIKFPLASGTIALTSNIPNPTDYYWANNKITSSSKIDAQVRVSSLGAGCLTTIANTVMATNWLRATGSTGIYFQDHAGGLYMSDDTWIRTYNSKALQVDNTIRSKDFNTTYIDSNSKWTITSAAKLENSTTLVYGSSTTSNGINSYLRGTTVTLQVKKGTSINHNALQLTADYIYCNNYCDMKYGAVVSGGNFTVNNNSYLAQKANTKVGIGTSSPSCLLDVSGLAKIYQLGIYGTPDASTQLYVNGHSKLLDLYLNAYRDEYFKQPVCLEFITFKGYAINSTIWSSPKSSKTNDVVALEIPNLSVPDKYKVFVFVTSDSSPNIYASIVRTAPLLLSIVTGGVSNTGQFAIMIWAIPT